MKIESLDFFYLSMPQVLDIGDGSQDALLVRARATGGHEGWGECEASPLASIAALVAPMSHSACKGVQDSVLGQTLETPDDICRIGDLVRRNSFDLLQADHTLSGIDIALWDLLARRREVPVYQLLGYKRQWRKAAYASQLFQDSPQQTFEAARKVAAAGFNAAKFGWGPYGLGSVEADAEQVRSAFEGFGADRRLLVDAGTVWGTDVAAAAARLPVLRECRVGWLEEPFVSGALGAYRELAALATQANVSLAAGEGCHNVHMARHLIDYAGIDFIQIDAGRIGGITAAKDVADYLVAGNNRVHYVNHTFTSHLALSASIQPYAGLAGSFICEYPADPKPLAWELTREHLTPDATGHVRVPEAPGLGVVPDPEAVRKYLVETEIVVGGKVLYRTPQI
jgi:L-alanine-DL-glutamate epimerase-like enolase superfamily enzyme